MKILITSDWCLSAVNGVATSIRNLADGLQAQGHEVRILTLAEDRHTQQIGNEILLGSVGAGAIYPHARLRITRGDALVQALIAWRPDIVHSQCEFFTFPLAKRIAHACGCPLVHTYHTLYENFTHYFFPSEPFGRTLAAWFSRHVLAQTDAVIAPTEKVRAALRRYGVAKPIYTISTGLKLDRFLAPVNPAARHTLREKLGLRRQDLALIFTGRLAQEKNIPELLQLLSAAPPQVKLLLVGDGPERQALETAAQQHGLQQRVVFTGMIPPSQIADYYKAGDVFVSASHSETQGLTYLEAMASGLPLLCRADPCLDGVLRAGETGFSYTDPAQFLAALAALSAPARRRMGEIARQTVQVQFSQARFVQAVLQVYTQCLRHRLEVPAA